MFPARREKGTKPIILSRSNALGSFTCRDSCPCRGRHGSDRILDAPFRRASIARIPNTLDDLIENHRPYSTGCAAFLAGSPRWGPIRFPATRGACWRTYVLRTAHLPAHSEGRKEQLRKVLRRPPHRQPLDAAPGQRRCASLPASLGILAAEEEGRGSAHRLPAGTSPTTWPPNRWSSSRRTWPAAVSPVRLPPASRLSSSFPISPAASINRSSTDILTGATSPYLGTAAWAFRHPALDRLVALRAHGGWLPPRKDSSLLLASPRTGFGTRRQ